MITKIEREKIRYPACNPTAGQLIDIANNVIFYPTPKGAVCFKCFQNHVMLSLFPFQRLGSATFLLKKPRNYEPLHRFQNNLQDLAFLYNLFFAWLFLPQR